MEQREEYDVLRLIEHGSICYVSSECVVGSPLVIWLKYHPNLSKEKLYEWIHESTRMLGLIHRCRGNPCYRYVNPYCLIVTEEERLYFLDLEENSNKEFVRQMQRRSIREHFLPPEEPYYQKSSVELDIYGLGRTIQYLLASVNPEPPLTRKEEAKFQKLISKCLRKKSKNICKKVSDIQKYIPIYRLKKKNKTTSKKRMILFFAAGICVMGALAAILWRPQTEQIPLMDEQKTEENELYRASGETAGEVNRELALLYLLNLEQPEKGLECLNEIEEADELTEDLMVIMKTLIHREKVDSGEVKTHLEHLETHMPEENQEYYYWLLVRGYVEMKDGSDEIDYEIIRVGEACLEILGDEKNQETETTYDETAGKCGLEVREAMAVSYENLEQYEESAHMYEELLQRVSKDEKREELYKKISMLYEEDEQIDMAMDTCIQGIEEFGESQELRVMHVRLLCGSSGVDDVVCTQTIREYVEQTPEILENEAFQKLQKEYGIQVEGEKVWIEK